MLITRVTEPTELIELVPHFLFQEESETSMFSQQLAQQLISTPTQVLVLVACEDKELRGFIVAEVGLGRHAWLHQVWIESKTGYEVADRLRECLMLWASAQGKTSVQAVTQRNVEALYRRFKFREISKTVQLDLDPELLTKTAWMLKEVQDGRI